jgi:hypothetical protein
MAIAYGRLRNYLAMIMLYVLIRFRIALCIDIMLEHFHMSMGDSGES